MENDNDPSNNDHCHPMDILALQQKIQQTTTSMKAFFASLLPILGGTIHNNKQPNSQSILAAPMKDFMMEFNMALCSPAHCNPQEYSTLKSTSVIYTLQHVSSLVISGLVLACLVSTPCDCQFNILHQWWIPPTNDKLAAKTPISYPYHSTSLTLPSQPIAWILHGCLLTAYCQSNLIIHQTEKQSFHMYLAPLLHPDHPTTHPAIPSWWTIEMAHCPFPN